jgi:hypothetical protein
MSEQEVGAMMEAGRDSRASVLGIHSAVHAHGLAA